MKLNLTDDHSHNEIFPNSYFTFKGIKYKYVRNINLRIEDTLKIIRMRKCVYSEVKYTVHKYPPIYRSVESCILYAIVLLPVVDGLFAVCTQE